VKSGTENIYRDVVALKPLSPELEKVRDNAAEGDKHALKVYVYFAVLQKIRGDVFVPPDKKLKTFKQLVDADIVEVRLA
jgi:hypothetical protein